MVMIQYYIVMNYLRGNYLNIVAVLANGIGSRFGSNVPKQFHKVNGKMVIEYVIESILKSKKNDKIVIATNIEANSVYLADICEKNDIDLIEGGETRNRTIRNVLDYIQQRYNCNSLIICDAVRPMITGGLMDMYFDMLANADAVVTAQRITDSLGCYSFQKVNREEYYLVQSPEGFNFKLLTEYFDSESNLTEVTQQLPENSKIDLYFDFNNNFKLTYQEDLKYLEALIKERENAVDSDNILNNVARLKSYLEKYYPIEAKTWAETLKNKITGLFNKWQIDEYSLIKTSHFGIIFIAHSIKYGRCVLKIIPPFIGKYEQERSYYHSINSGFMCELFDYDDSCSALLMECCDEVEKFNEDTVLAFFGKAISNAVNKNTDVDLKLFHSYSSILHSKIKKTNFEYKKDAVMSYVKDAIRIYDESFNNDDAVMIHGDLHRHNIMSKNGSLVAIDPIGYIAPAEINVARYIGTELTDGIGDIKESYDALIGTFSKICDFERLKKACFIDIVFRLHNSIFENEDYILTDKWLKILESID